MKRFLRDLQRSISLIATESRIFRKDEQKQTRWARFLGKRHHPGYFKHGLGAEGAVDPTLRPAAKTDWRFYETVGEGEDKQRVLSNTQPTDEERRRMELAAYERRWNLHHQRTHTLRKRARVLNLAYGCLRGKPYAEIEAKAYEAPDFEEIEKVVRQHATGSKNAVNWLWLGWFVDAMAHWDDQNQERVLATQADSVAN